MAKIYEKDGILEVTSMYHKWLDFNTNLDAGGEECTGMATLTIDEARELHRKLGEYLEARE